MILMAGRSTGRNIVANHPAVPTAPADPLPDLTKTNPDAVESFACIESVAYARVFVHATLHESFNSPNENVRVCWCCSCFEISSLSHRTSGGSKDDQ